MMNIRPLNEDDISLATAFLIFINELINESIKISFRDNRSLEEEIEWLKATIRKMRQKKMLQMVATHNNDVIGMSDITLLDENKSHVGDFGIALRKDFRKKKLGEDMVIKTTEAGIAFFGHQLRLLKVCFPASKEKVVRFYEKAGFKVVAKIPDQYFFERMEDEIVMIKYL